MLTKIVLTTHAPPMKQTVLKQCGYNYDGVQLSTHNLLQIAAIIRGYIPRGWRSVGQNGRHINMLYRAFNKCTCTSISNSFPGHTNENIDMRSFATSIGDWRDRVVLFVI